MTENVSTNNPPIYAECFSTIGITGVRWLGYRDVPQLIKEHVRGTKTLDYGCGTAWSTKLLKSLGLDVDGVDINEYMIKGAKKKDPQGKYTLIKSGAILENNCTYDFVFCGFVLHYISSKGELQKIVTDIARVLKKGGVFIVIAVSEEASKHDRWESVSTNYEENKQQISGSNVTMLWKQNGLFMHFYYWTEKDYREVLANAGLKVVHIHRPLGLPSDGYDWNCETENHFTDVYVAIK